MARILMVGPDNEVIDRRIIQQAESLTARGHDVVLFSGFEAKEEAVSHSGGILIRRFKFDWSDPRALYVMRRLRRRPGSRFFSQIYVKVRQLIALRSGLNQFEHFMLRKILSVDFDIIHAHDLPVLKVCLEAARRRGVPVVYDAHEMYPKQSYLTPKTQRHLAELEKRLVRKVAAMSTVNEFIADIMASEYRIEKPVVIYNSVPTETVLPRTALRSELGIPHEARILLFQGWLSSIRGVDDVIRAVPFMDPSIHFVVVGYGDILDTLRSLASELGVADRVHFTGRVEPEDMLGYSAAADLGIIPYKGVDPNYYHCSPNKLFEFTMAGLPMVANDLPFLSWIGTRYGHILTVDTSRPEALGGMINEALLVPGCLDQLRTKAVAAREILNWESDEVRLAAMFDRVITRLETRDAKTERPIAESNRSPVGHKPDISQTSDAPMAQAVHSTQ